MTGAYFYFEDIIYDGLAQYALGMVSSMIFERIEEIVIDTLMGDLMVLKERPFLEILASYPDLLEIYKSSDKKLVAKKTIIRKLNERL